MTRNLYYWLGRIWKKDITKVREFLKDFPDIIPVYSIHSRNDEVVLSVLMDGKGKTKIKWKKFRDPTFLKYTNATLYRFEVINMGRDYGFLIREEEELKEIIIDYNILEIYIPSSLIESERKMVMNLAEGKLGLSPFDPLANKEQTLIL